MACECPDSRFFEDLADLNREFLGLVTSPCESSGQSVLGLDPISVDMLCSLTDSELRYIAETPCLLAGFSAPQPGIGEARRPFANRDTEWAEAVRMFSVALLSFLRVTMGGDRLRAALCVGPERDALVRFADISLGGIRRHASFAAGRLHARLADVPVFWPDLIRAARSDDTEFRRLSRLTAIPLVVVPTGSLRKHTV